MTICDKRTHPTPGSPRRHGGAAVRGDCCSALALSSRPWAPAGSWPPGAGTALWAAPWRRASLRPAIPWRPTPWGRSTATPAPTVWRRSRPATPAGYRLFECDLAMAADGRVVLRHDWSDGAAGGGGPGAHPHGGGVFRDIPLYGQYTPLTFLDLLGLLAPLSGHLCDPGRQGYGCRELWPRQYAAMVEEARGAGACSTSLTRLHRAALLPGDAGHGGGGPPLRPLSADAVPDPLLRRGGGAARSTSWPARRRGIEGHRHVALSVHAGPASPSWRAAASRSGSTPSTTRPRPAAISAEGARGVFSDRIDPAEVTRA